MNEQQTDIVTVAADVAKDSPMRRRYDPMEFAAKHGLTMKAAQVILQTNGPSREKCDAGARAFLKAVAARTRA